MVKASRQPGRPSEARDDVRAPAAPSGVPYVWLSVLGVRFFSAAAEGRR